jgi:hypothetical protein
LRPYPPDTTGGNHGFFNPAIVLQAPFGACFRTRKSQDQEEEFSDASPFSGFGHPCRQPHHGGEQHRPGTRPSNALWAFGAPAPEPKAMSALKFTLCLGICSLVGLMIGIASGNAPMGFTIGLAAGAAIASVLIALTDEPT